MKLKTLTIEVNRSWQENPGKYEGTIVYEGKAGEVKLLLDSKVSEALLACIGTTVTEFAHAASLQLKESIDQSIAEARKAPEIDVT